MEATKTFQQDEKEQKRRGLPVIDCDVHNTLSSETVFCIRISRSVGVGIIRCWEHLTASEVMSHAVCLTGRVTMLGPPPVIVRVQI